MKNLDRRTPADGHAGFITTSDFGRLKLSVHGENRYLSDNIVNTYLHLLGDYYPQKQTWFRILDSFQYKRLQDGNLKILFNNAVTTILFPICENSHWDLGIICHIRRKITYITLDTYPGEEYRNASHEAIKKYLSENHVDWINVKTYRQSNYDCGVFMLYFIQRFLMSPKETLNKFFEGEFKPPGFSVDNFRTGILNSLAEWVGLFVFRKLGRWAETFGTHFAKYPDQTIINVVSIIQRQSPPNGVLYLKTVVPWSKGFSNIKSDFLKAHQKATEEIAKDDRPKTRAQGAGIFEYEIFVLTEKGKFCHHWKIEQSTSMMRSFLRHLKTMFYNMDLENHHNIISDEKTLEEGFKNRAFILKALPSRTDPETIVGKAPQLRRKTRR